MSNFHINAYDYDRAPLAVWALYVTLSQLAGWDLDKYTRRRKEKKVLEIEAMIDPATIPDDIAQELLEFKKKALANSLKTVVRRTRS